MGFVRIGKQLAVAPAVAISDEEVSVAGREELPQPAHFLRAMAVGRGETPRQPPAVRHFDFRPYHPGDAEMPRKREDPIGDACADDYHLVPLAQMLPDAACGFRAEQILLPRPAEVLAQGVELVQGHPFEEIAEQPLLGFPVRIQPALAGGKERQIPQQPAQEPAPTERKEEKGGQRVGTGESAVEVECREGRPNHSRSHHKYRMRQKINIQPKMQYCTKRSFIRMRVGLPLFASTMVSCR